MRACSEARPRGYWRTCCVRTRLRPATSRQSASSWPTRSRTMNEALLVSFLLSALCHGTCLLVLVWLLGYSRLFRALAGQEAAWRFALIVPQFSAALQVSSVRTVAPLEWR